MRYTKQISILIVCGLFMGTGMASATAPEQKGEPQMVKESVEDSKGWFVFEANGNDFVADKDYFWEDEGMTYSLKKGDVIGSYQGDRQR